MRRIVTDEQYDSLCDVIDRAKNDDRSLDTDEYAAEALRALDLGTASNLVRGA